MRHITFAESEISPLTPGEYEEVLNMIFNDSPVEDPAPSLYDLFDIETDVGLPDSDSFPASSALAAAANAVFSDAVFEQCVPETPEPDGRSTTLNTPDLVCPETVPETPLQSPVNEVNSSEVGIACAPEMQYDYELDCPAVPGVNCKSCEYHKKRATQGDIKCSLCYMRLTSFFVYSKS